jgi:hypothetical protein
MSHKAGIGWSARSLDLGGHRVQLPQHHRPTTYSPVDYTIVAGEGGKKTVRLGDVDQMYGTKSIASISLYPDKAYVEIEGQLYNQPPLTRPSCGGQILQ